MQPAVITFTFDSVLTYGDGASVRFETLFLAIVLFVALLDPTQGSFKIGRAHV